MQLKPLAGLIALMSVSALAAGCNGTASQKSIEVSKALGTRQCEENETNALDQLAETLTQAGVEVLSKKQADDGKSRIMLCGSPDGRIGIFAIPASQLEKAQSAGFTTL